MEKTFLLYLSVHWGDLIEQIKKICHKLYTLSSRATRRKNFAFMNVDCYILFFLVSVLGGRLDYQSHPPVLNSQLYVLRGLGMVNFDQ